MSSGGSLTRAASHGQMLLAIANMGNRNGQNIVIRKDVAEAGHLIRMRPWLSARKSSKARPSASMPSARW